MKSREVGYKTPLFRVYFTAEFQTYLASAMHATSFFESIKPTVAQQTLEHLCSNPSENNELAWLQTHRSKHTSALTHTHLLAANTRISFSSATRLGSLVFALSGLKHETTNCAHEFSDVLYAC